MEVCEICNKEKTYKEHTFNEGIYAEQTLSAWVYNCKCPTIGLYEIDRIRKLRIKLNKEQRQKLIGLLRQKKIIFDINKYNYEDYGIWDRIRISQKNDKGEQRNRIFNPEACEVQIGINKFFDSIR
jgi:hypothetical protein